jgi:hypothetical protein
MKFRTASVLTALLCAAQITLSAPLALAAEAAVPARVSVAYAGMPLKDALRQFQEASGLRLAYAEDLLAGAAPVTLRLDDAPAERVLRELLRPQGLEAVLTDKNLAAIVPARSDLGMAKAFGRALDIGLRLGNKLDGAVVVGDEVKVPGWTAEDDEDLALGITDLVTAIAYASSRSWTNSSQVGQDERVEAIRALLQSADPLVRAGALTLLANYGVMNSGIREFGREIEQGFADPHPVVRTASAFQFAVSTGRGNGQWEGQTAAAAMLRKLAADPEAGVRMAAALALLISSHHVINPAMDPDGALLDQLLADRSAFVRQTLRLGALALNDPRAGAPEGPAKTKWLALSSDDGLKATLRDPNPIARAVSFALARIQQLDQQLRDKAAPRDRVAEIWTEAELAKDPWMQTVHGLIAPALAGDYQVALETMVTALGSEKPSHQAAALLSLSLGSTLLGRGMPQAAARGEQPAPPKIPDLAPLTARLASSDWLWARLSGIALDTALPFVAPLSATPLPPEALQAAEDRLQAALRDPSEPMRLVALLAQSGRTMAGLPSQPEAILAALRGRSVPEMLLGVMIASQQLDADTYVTELQAALADSRRRGAAMGMIQNLARNRDLQKRSPEEQKAFGIQLAESVIAAQDRALEMALIDTTQGSLKDVFAGVDEGLKAKGSFQAASQTMDAKFFNDEMAQQTLCARLADAAADPARRIEVLAAWTRFAGYWTFFRPGGQKALDAALDAALAGKTPADAREAKARLKALTKQVEQVGFMQSENERRSQLARLTPNVARAYAQCLALAEDPAYAPDAAILLGRTLRALSGSCADGETLREAWTANHPELLQVLDAAVAKVLAGNRLEDKIEVWSGQGDKPAFDALAQLVIAGKATTPDLLTRVTRAFGPMPPAAKAIVPPEYGAALLAIVRDPKQNAQMRSNALSGLATDCGHTMDREVAAIIFDPAFSAELRAQAARNSSAAAFAFGKALESYDALPLDVAVGLAYSAMDKLRTPNGATGAEDLLLRVLGDKRLLAAGTKNRQEKPVMTLWLLINYCKNMLETATFMAGGHNVTNLRKERWHQALDKLAKDRPAEYQGQLDSSLQELRQALDQLKPAGNTPRP